MTAFDDKAADFWDWFVSHEASIRAVIARAEALEGGDNGDEQALANDLNRAVEELCDALERFDCRLAAYISARPDLAGKRELVISAEGDVQAFTTVRRLVAASPAIGEWQVTALKPREALVPVGIEVDGEMLSVDKISFALAYDNGLVDILIVLDCDDIDIDEDTGVHVISLLEALLGEEDLATRVGGLGLETLCGVDRAIELRPIGELPNAFDAFFRH